MPILTKPAVTRGSSSSFSLSKSDLAALTVVSSDAHFAASANWQTVVVSYKSTLGGQSKTVIYDATLAGNTLTSSFTVSSKSRGDFQVQSIVIIDKDGGKKLIPRSALTVSEFDVSFAPAETVHYSHNFVTENALRSYEALGGNITFAELQVSGIRFGGADENMDILNNSVPFIPNNKAFKVRVYASEAIGTGSFQSDVNGTNFQSITQAAIRTAITGSTYVEFSYPALTSNAGSYLAFYTGGAFTSMKVTRIEVISAA